MLRWIALLLVLGIPLTLWGVVHFGAVASDTSGPTALATTDNRVVVAANGTFFLLDEAGNTLGTFDARAAGVDPWTSGMLWLSPNELLVAGDRDGHLLRCTIAPFGCGPAKLGRAATTWSVPIKLLREGNELFISRGNSGVIMQIDIDSGETRTAVSGLHHANNLFIRDGMMYIGDTDNARIATCVPDSAAPCSKPHDWASGFSLAGLAHTRPTQIADDGAGGAWAIMVNLNMADGTLVRVDATGKEIAVIDIPGRGHLASLTRFGTDLLVIDSDTFRVWRVNDAGKADEFGDATFRQTLAAIHEIQTSAADRGLYCLLGMFGLLLAIAVLAAIDSAVRTAASKKMAAPPGE